jgi:uncharacterized protein
MSMGIQLVKTVALLPAHPSQVWVLHQVAKELAAHVNVLWYLRDKDRSGEIATALGIEFKILSTARKGLVGNAIEMLVDTFRAIRETRQQDIDLWVTKFGAGNIAAMLLGRKSLSFNDDDVDLVPMIAATSYRFAEKVLVTDVTRMGKYENKASRYSSFHELFYLHPARFTPDAGIRQELGLSGMERYGIVRLSALTAHHDVGIRGIAKEFLLGTIDRYKREMRVFVSAEKELDFELKRFQLEIKPERMHHALAYADFFLGDSQTMTAEAAVLGTPALRLNDFVGRISYLAELERYGLAYGFRPGEEPALLDRLDTIIRDPNSKQQFAMKRQKMLDDKIEPAPWFAQQILRALETR